MTIRVIGRPSRSTLLISTVEQRTDETPDNAAAAPKNGGATDDDGGNDDQLGAQSVLRGYALVLRRRHQAGHRGAERRQQIGANPHPSRRDAGVDRRLLVAAGREGLVAPAGLGEDHGSHRHDDQRDLDLIVEAPGVELAEPEEPAIICSLFRVENRLATRQAENEATADQEDGERRDEGRDAQDGDEHAIDQANERSQHQARENGRHHAEVIVVGVEHVCEGDTDKAECRSDRQVEILVGDDERHANGHHRIARGVAQKRLGRVEGDEEFRIDEGARDVEERHHDQQARFPATKQL